MEKRPALGKGLSALIPDAADALSTSRPTFEVDIDQLEPNHYQPRGHMDDARLDELSRSIKVNGVIQPIVVRRLDNTGSPRHNGSKTAAHSSPTVTKTAPVYA